MNGVRLLTLLVWLSWPSLAGSGVEERPSEFTLELGFLVTNLRDVSRTDVDISLRFWVDELIRSQQLRATTHLYDKVEAMRQDFSAGRINMIVLSGAEVVRHFPLEELAEGFIGYTDQPDNLLLVARQGAGIRSAADLAGKRLILTDSDPLSSLYLETLALRTFGDKGESALGAVIEVPRSNLAINRLFFGDADAALVSRSALDLAVNLNPQIGERTHVLDAYTLAIRSLNVGLFSRKVSLEDREHVLSIALELMKTPRGQQILELYRTAYVDRCGLENLEPVRRLFLENQALRARYPKAYRRQRP